MGTLLAFAPFIGFVVFERLVGALPGLIAGAIIAAILVVRGLIGKKSLKVLEVGTVILFGGLAAYAALTTANWPAAGVRLRVDAGLLLIVLISVALRRPFTLQYAREQVAREFWDRPEFVRANYIITAVWAAAFAVMVAADVIMLGAAGLPPSAGILVTVLAIVAAVKFTAWYPERIRRQA